MTPHPSPPDVDERRLDEACRRLGLRALVLYGSRATGTPPPSTESDLDLALRFRPGTDRPPYRELHRALGDVFPDDSLDLVVLQDADPLFRWEILREGVLLWGDPLEHLEYRAFAWRDFVDSADLRRLERVLFGKKLAYVRERLRASR